MVVAAFRIFETACPTESVFAQQQLHAFENAVCWLESRGISVVRVDLSARPAMLVENPEIQSLIEHSGTSALPVTLMDGAIKLVGRYPSQAELSAWAKLQHPLFTYEDKGSSCSGSQCGL